METVVAEARLETRVELTAEFNRVLEAQRRESSTQIGELKERMETVVGRLPVARAYEPGTVVYAGAIITHAGCAWQAKCDTAQTPGGSDWLLIAQGGRDGVCLSLRGAFDLDDSYSAMDVVVYEGQATSRRVTIPAFLASMTAGS